MMIVYDRLWQTMKDRKISQYKLIQEYGFSTGQLDRLRKNQNANTYTLDILCKILSCELSDIAEYLPDQLDDATS
jgi:putative transcriptional regulator